MASRDHNQGNQGRSYTPEQKAAVIRIRKCAATAFYEILELSKTCSDGEIKKAYRKQSLLTHPDKNGHEHADEAFKMVSRAFGVLGDKEKREKFDRYGTDPDSRFESARAQAGNPFAGGPFANGNRGFPGQGGGGGGGGMWEDEISPEEMFARFFGGGFGGGGFGGPFGGGGFDAGPQFVFNLGGQRGFRVHQMGGAAPRGRPRQATGQAAPERSGWETFLGLLPILFFLLFPIITSVFSGSDAQASLPKMAFDVAKPPQTFERATSNYAVKYFVNPTDVAGWTDHKLKQLDKEAETVFIRSLQKNCELEQRTQQRLVDDAQGWFFEDPDKMNIARNFQMPNCKRLKKLGAKRY